METKLEGCANVNKGVDFIFLKKKKKIKLFKILRMLCILCSKHVRHRRREKGKTMVRQKVELCMGPFVLYFQRRNVDFKGYA